MSTAERIDGGKAGFVGEIVAKEHGSAAGERRFLHEGADHLALARAAGLEFEHALSGLQGQYLGVTLGEVFGECAGNLLQLRRLTKMQGKGDALVLQVQAGMLAAGLLQLTLDAR